MRAVLASLLILAGSCQVRAQGTVRQVPGQYASIQAAINASSHGDTILVAAGQYAGPVDFMGRDVSVVAAAGPGLTSIDGGGSGPCVRMVGHEGPAAILDGFKISNGRGQPHGGGILCDAASGTIRNCVIVANAARDGTTGGGGSGGGIFVRGPVSAPTFEDCVIGNNRSGNGGTLFHNINWRSAYDAGCGGGAAVVQGASVEFRSCTFEFNTGGQGGTATNDPAGRGGCGAGLAVAIAASVMCRDCVFRSNVCGPGGSSFGLFGSPAGGGSGGGAMVFSGSSARFDRCRFELNKTAPAVTYTNYSGSPVTIPPGLGGGIMGHQVDLVSCVFRGNQAGGSSLPGSGGGAWMAGGSLLNCTFSQNAGSPSGLNSLGGIPVTKLHLLGQRLTRDRWQSDDHSIHRPWRVCRNGKLEREPAIH